MSCENVQELISSYLDRMVESDERDIALTHLSVCRTCHARYESMRINREALRELPMPAAPLILETKLRVLASHAQARQLATASWRVRARYWRGMARLKFENLMKPFALPAAGGLVSAILMFGMVLPSISFGHNSLNDLPSDIFTNPDGRVVGEGPRPKLEPVSASSRGTIVVVLTIDYQGRVRDYTVTRGKLTPEVQNFILFSVFDPATSFGRPTWGRVQVEFGDSGELKDLRS
jgi:Putative zinc-finger